MRFTISPPEGSNIAASILGIQQRTTAVSPDGRHIAFIATFQGRPMLWIRAIDSLSARPLAEADVAGFNFLFWSPDSRFVCFAHQNRLMKVSIEGGSAEKFGDSAGTLGGGSWSPDGTILFGLGSGNPLHRVLASGGQPQAQTALDAPQEVFHRYPRFLPDGRHFLYIVRSTQPDNSGIYVGSLNTKEKRRILGVVSEAQYVPPGYLLYVRSGTLVAQRFNADRLELSGEPVTIAHEVSYDPTFGTSEFSASDNGVVVYRSGSAQTTELLWFDRSGKLIASVGQKGPHLNPELSPDGRVLAEERIDPSAGNKDIWLMELVRSIATRFTFDRAEDLFPVWSADGRRILFSSEKGGVMALYQKLSSGAGSDELLFRSRNSVFSYDWSLDGRFIIYSDLGPKGNRQIWVLPQSGERKPFPFHETQFEERQGQISPDGRWMAYISNESGIYEVYVQSFPKPGGKWQISTGGGFQPRWRRDGKELFYLAADEKLMSVPVKVASGPSALEFGGATPLFEARPFGGATLIARVRHQYAVSADGQRFFVNRRVEEASSPITVVLNWTAMLKR